ncbi:MAG TPA: nuclear transport factor 2 family protein [Acidimicrobiales bacterium]|nr:nuclear transport factor 2 family protein [Acidimicrobiales bacterium]
MNWTEWANDAVATLAMSSGQGDEAWVGLFAPGGTYQDPVTAQTSDVAAVFAVTRSSFPDWEMTVTSASGDSTGGVMEWIGRGHLPHGPAVVLHGCSVIDLSSEAKVVRWRDYFSMGEFARQASMP